MAKKKTGRFLNNNENLPINEEFEWTPELIEEFKKCQQDVFYFAENFFYIVNVDLGKIAIKLHEPQKKALQTILDNRFSIICASRQIGKRLAIDTPVPSPSGWTTMGELKDGDVIFDWNGTPTTVVKAHDISNDRHCFEVTFSNGEKIIADEEHEWFTQHKSERQKGILGSVKTTKQIFDTLLNGKKEPEPAHRIPYKHCVQYPEKDLPIDPYLFGYWLGDGASSAARLTIGKQDYEDFKNNFQHLDNLKVYNLKDKTKAMEIGINKFLDGESFVSKIKKLGVFNNKHIPAIYLQASEEQRMELLRGLLDTDGTCQKNGVILFYSSILELSNNVEELLNSLGIQCKRTSKIGKIKDKQYKRCYMLTFKTDKKVFKLTRKSDRQFIKLRPNTTHSRNNFIYIKDVQPVQPVPTRCITVDNADQMYLVGKTFIPTHNTTIMTILCLWLTMFRSNYSVAVIANKEDIALEILDRIKSAYEEMPNWLKAGIKTFAQSKVQFVNGSKIYVSTTSANAIRGKTVNLVFMDEFAFVPKEIAEQFFRSVLPTITSGNTSKLVACSTPNGAEGKFYEIFSDAERGRSKWAHIKIYWHEIPGRDLKWKADVMAMNNNDQIFWDQEYDIKFLENGTSAINADLIEYLKNLSKNTAPLATFDNGDYRIWKEPEKDHIYSIGVDAAEGVGQDNSVAQILDITDPSNMELVGSYVTNKMQPYVFAERINEIARSWGRPFLCIESNKEGSSVIDALMNVHLYDNIITYTMKNDREGRYQKPGIFCHQNSKYTGIMNMKYYLEFLQGVKIYDMDTVKEFETFVRKENKTWGAKKGFKDDRIMSLIWALVILERDIAEKYLEILDVADDGKVISIADPNQDIANQLLESSGPKKIAYARLGNQPPPSLFQFGSMPSYRDAEISDYMSSGFKFV